MLKRVLTILVSLLILVQSMRGTMMYVSLKINQDEIAAKYCTSDNVPICYGSCYIEKQLKSLEKETEKTSSSNNSIEKITFWFIATSAGCPQLNVPIWHLLPKEINIHDVPQFASSYLKKIFQPPRFSVF